MSCRRVFLRRDFLRGKSRLSDLPMKRWYRRKSREEGEWAFDNGHHISITTSRTDPLCPSERKNTPRPIFKDLTMSQDAYASAARWQQAFVLCRLYQNIICLSTAQQHITGEHQTEAEEQGVCCSSLGAVGVGLGDHFVRDDIEHSASCKGKSKG